MGFKIQKAKSVEDGDYKVALTTVEQATGQYGPCLKFFFKITEGEFEDMEVSMLRPSTLVPGNKLDKTLQNMGVDTTGIDDELDVDTLKGKSFLVKVNTKTSDKGKVFSNVTEVLKVLDSSSAPRPQRTSTPPVVTAPSLEDVPF